MDRRLEIAVLGELLVTLDGQPVPLPPSRKTRALLAHLAVAHRPQRRERLCEMFWDVPDDPRGALRWSLSKIRQVVNHDGLDRVASQRDTVWLRTDGVDVDFHRVAPLAGRRLEDLEAGELEAAVASFRGAFLEDLHLPRCPDFEAWRTAHANEMEILRLKLLRQLVQRLRGQPERALAHAHALRSLSPDDDALAHEIETLSAAARANAAAIAAAASPQPAALVAPVAPPPAEDVRTLTSRDGVRIACVATGGGPPLVRAAHWLSHVVEDRDSPIWRPWIEGLSRDHRLIRYDQRCGGLSDDAADLSLEAMVGDLETVVDGLGLDRFALLGVSQSCAVSVAYAVQRPERVTHLVLYGGYVRGWRRREDPGEIASREAISVLMREGWGRDHPLFRQLFASLFLPRATPEQSGWLSDLQRRTVSPANAYRLQAAFSEIDVSALLPSVGVPTLVIHAAGDAVAPVGEGRRFAEGIPGARFVELDSPNHILMRDEPAFERFLGEVRSFLAEPARGRPAAAKDAGPADEAQGQARKQISVLALELIVPALSFEATDPELGIDLMTPLNAAATDAVLRHGGVIVQRGETHLVAVFGAPTASEHHAWQACRAALAAREAVDRAAAGGARLRAGLDSGEAVVRRQGGGGPVEVLGAPVRLARQLAQGLRRGVIAATARVRDGAGGTVRMEPLARAEHPGFGRERQLFQLVEEVRAASGWHLRPQRRLTRLVGREAELGMLGHALHRAAAGHGKVIGVVADPGFGKSRLTHEFLASDEVARSGGAIEAGALEFDAGVGLSLIKKLLRALCGVESCESPEAAIAKAKDWLSGRGGDGRLLSPLLFTLDLPVTDAAWTGLDAGERASQVREAVLALLSVQARQAPLVVLIEDLHWMDAESEEVLRRVFDAIASQPILAITTYRPEYHPPWAQKASFQQIRLDPLDGAEARRLLGALLGDDPSLDPLLPLLAERGDGVPLLMEELVRTLAESGRLIGGPGAYRAPAPVAEVEVPLTVQSAIGARFDRLSEIGRKILQIAAVIGKDIPLPLLAATAGLPDAALRGALDRLTEAEFLFEAKSFPEKVFTFKHALTHDVAHASLLKEPRRLLHGRVLDAMGRLYGERMADHVEKMADHALGAERWEEAVPLCLEAADRATDRSAYGIAARALGQAVRALEALPETDERLRQAIDIRTRMRPALEGCGEFRQAFARLDEARLLALRLKDDHRLAQVLLHQSYIHSTHGRLDAALAWADALRDLARRTGSLLCASEADMASAQALLMRSRAAEADRLLAPRAEHYLGPWRTERFGQLATRGVWFQASRSLAAAMLGDPARAAAMADHADAIAHEFGRPFDLVTVRFFRAKGWLHTGPRREDVAELAAMIEGGRNSALPIFAPWLLTVLGHLRFVMGERAEAEAILTRALAAAERSDMRQFHAHAGIALACCRGGAALDKALEDATALGDVWLRAVVLREMAWRDGGEAAIHHLTTACEETEAAGLRPEAARCHEALARLLSPGRG